MRYGLLQPQHDGRAFFHERSVTELFGKCRTVHTQNKIDLVKLPDGTWNFPALYKAVVAEGIFRVRELRDPATGNLVELFRITNASWRAAK